MDMTNISRRIVKAVKNHGGDVKDFRADVLDIAQDTARCIAVTVDDDVTAQLKAALLFLYGLADGASAAPETDEGDAKPEPADGYPLDL